MGLDILVKKILPPTAENIALAENWENNITEYVVSGNDGSSELAIYADFLFKKPITYYDWKGTFEKGNLDFNDYKWCATAGEPMFQDTKLSDEQVIEDEKLHNELWFTFERNNTEEKPEYWWIEEKNIIKFVQEEDCLLAVEVGYQRKGANQQFYQDGMWDSKCVTDRTTLLEHWDKYFSYETPNSEGGWGSGTEYTNVSDPERRERFRMNIIDNFIDNETFVVYA